MRHLLACLLLCGCQGVQGDLLRTLPEPDMATAPVCTTATVGSAATCSGEADFKVRASSLCTAEGRALTSLAFSESCGAGQYRYAKYECCPTTPQGACSAQTQGGETSCKGERDWYNAAVDLCAASKQVPMSLMFTRPCADMGGLYRYVRYLCCPAAMISGGAAGAEPFSRDGGTDG